MPPVPMTPIDGDIILEATDAHRDELETFLFQNLPTYRHLDWFTPLDLIGEPPFLIEYRGQSIQSVLCATPENQDAAWVRTFAVRGKQHVETSWKTLLPRAVQILREIGVYRLAALGLGSGFEALLAEGGFSNRQNILPLIWEQVHLDSERENQNLLIRPMQLDDLQAVAAIDHLAFDPLWQNSLAGLTRAFYQKGISTVAEQDNAIVGYQISTITTTYGHLARLAVHPDRQRQGIGRILVKDLLRQFEPLRLMRVTVNTQSDNLPSLQLYKALGFSETHEEIRVYELFL